MKKILTGILIGVIIAFGALILSDRATRAQDNEMPNTEFIKKLDDIIAMQKKMMDAITAMKQELNIVKIRVTQQQ